MAGELIGGVTAFSPLERKAHFLRGPGLIDEPSEYLQQLLRRKPGVAANTAMQLSPMRCGRSKRYFRGLPAGFAPDSRRSDSPFNRKALRIKLYGFSGKSALRSVTLEIPMSPVKGLSSSKQKYRAGKRQRACQQR